MADRRPTGLSEGDDDDVLAELRSLASRSRPDQVTWEEPPAGLWDRIAAQAATQDLEQVPGAARKPDPSRGVDDVQPGLGGLRPGEGVGRTDELHARRARREQRPTRSRAPWLTAAAAVVLLVVVTVGVLVQRGSDQPEVLAVTELEVLGDGGEGTAELIDDQGHRRLRVTTSGLDAGDGFLEVWLIDEAVTKLVSLGPLRADGVYDLPDGLDPAAYPVVDISVEPFNGDPTHSGNSLLRGQLSV